MPLRHCVTEGDTEGLHELLRAAVGHAMVVGVRVPVEDTLGEVETERDMKGQPDRVPEVEPLRLAEEHAKKVAHAMREREGAALPHVGPEEDTDFEGLPLTVADT